MSDYLSRSKRSRGVVVVILAGEVELEALEPGSQVDHGSDAHDTPLGVDTRLQHHERERSDHHTCRKTHDPLHVLSVERTAVVAS
jgi:hypothetical protein